MLHCLRSGSLPWGGAWSQFRNDFGCPVMGSYSNGQLIFGGGIEGDESSIIFPSNRDPPNHAVVLYINGALPNHFGYDTCGSGRPDFPETSIAYIWRGRTNRVFQLGSRRVHLICARLQNTCGRLRPRGPSRMLR